MKKKMVSAITLTLLLTSMPFLAFDIRPVKAEPKTWTVDDDGPADFHAIQEAVDAASPGDTILVASGTYTEWDDVYIRKTISLLGESPNSTILERGIAIINANNVRVSGFTLDCLYRPGVAAMHIYCSNNVILSNNFIKGNGNDAINNDRPNVFLSSSNNCTLRGNTWMPYECADGGRAGLHFFDSTGNIIVANNFLEGGIFPWEIWDEGGNTFYHNNFWKPGFPRFSENSIWDDGYPSGGNYWSDYAGNDTYSGPYQNETGCDGIGDTPYTIDENNSDNHPLMIPWGSLLGDVNGDGYVGIDDIFLVASRFSKELGDPEYSRVYDLNGDGYVGIDDIFTAAQHFGEENP